MTDETTTPEPQDGHQEPEQAPEQPQEPEQAPEPPRRVHVDSRGGEHVSRRDAIDANERFARGLA